MRTLEDVMPNLLETLLLLQMIEHHLDGSTLNNSHPVVSENVDPHIQENFGKADGLAVSPAHCIENVFTS